MIVFYHLIALAMQLMQEIRFQPQCFIMWAVRMEYSIFVKND